MIVYIDNLVDGQTLNEHIIRDLYQKKLDSPVSIKAIKPDVQTICIGMAASMGAFLLTAGAKGKRYALPNAEVMIHQPLGGKHRQSS